MKSLTKSKLAKNWSIFKNFVENKLEGVETGIECLDKYLLGLGGIVNIQGETSSCKSVLALQIAHYNLKKGNPVLMIDKENGIGRIMLRLVCQANTISEAQFMAAETEARNEYCKSIANYDLHLHTEAITSTEVLAQRIQECAKLYNKRFIVLIDSIQALDMIDDTQRVSLERWVGFLDQVKLDLAGQATLIFVSEKNRSSYGSQGAGGGKGSNVVDYKPETILDIRWNEETDTFLVKVSKHRDGIKGAKFELKKVMSNEEDNRSFTFLLDETDYECQQDGLDREISDEDEI